MLKTEYTLPFACELPARNPWNGAHAVQLWLDLAQIDGSSPAIAAQWIQLFWKLASRGALAGQAGTPRVLTLPQPRLSVQGARIGFTFESCELDERATSCLLSLVLAGHAAMPVRRFSLETHGISRDQIEVTDTLPEPYPRLPNKLPFVCHLDDSESETRTVTLHASQAFGAVELERITALLMDWAAAVNGGAFGIAPVSPSECDCIPDEIQADDAEAYWPLDKCRFHPAALECLVSMCAALERETPMFSSCSIE